MHGYKNALDLNLDKSDCERVVKVIKEFYKKEK